MAIDPFMGTRPQQAFLATVVVQTIAVLALVAVVFGEVANHVTVSQAGYRTLPCFFALFALAELFYLIVAIDALRLRNIIQLIGILLFHGAMIVFGALQIRQTKTAIVKNPDTDDFTTGDSPGSLWSHIRPLLIAVPCILGASWLALVYWVRALYYEFGWAVFHAVGANPRMKTMYQFYQVMICLLKFDFFACVGLTMQLLILVLSHDTAEFGLTIAAIPVVLVLLATCGWAVKREIKWLMTISLALMVASLVYFVFKLVRYYSPSTETQYSTTRGTLTFFTVASFLLVLASFAIGLRCFSDFDKGLMEAKLNDTLLPRRSNKVSAPGTPVGMGERGSSYMSGPQLAPRMSIE